MSHGRNNINTRENTTMRAARQRSGPGGLRRMKKKGPRKITSPPALAKRVCATASVRRLVHVRGDVVDLRRAQLRAERRHDLAAVCDLLHNSRLVRCHVVEARADCTGRPGCLE